MMKSFRVASFNVENLAHPGAFFAGRPTDAPYDEALDQDKIGWIGRVLDEGRVDLVGFQELFSFTAVKDAVARSSYLSADGNVRGGCQKSASLLATTKMQAVVSRD